MFRKRMIEEFEWKLQQAKAEIRAEYQNKYNVQCEDFERATEIQQGLYDKKIRQLEEVAKTAYQKGRNEVLDLVREKIQSGELVRGRTNEPNEQPHKTVQAQE